MIDEFDHIADAYSTHVVPHFSLAHDYAVSYAASGGYQTIVDIACGDGRLLARLATELPDATVVGVDHSPALLERASEHARDAVLIKADAHELPLCSETSELTICAFALRLFRAPAIALEELIRVTRREGTLLVLALLGADSPAADAGAVAACAEWHRHLFSAARAVVVSEETFNSSTEVTTPGALAGLLRGEVGGAMGSTRTESELRTLAPVLLERHGGSMTFEFTFAAYCIGHPQ